MRAVLALLRAFLRIGLLQEGPQSLPASRELTFVVIGAHWAVGLVLSLLGQAPQVAFVSAVVGTLLMVAIIHGLLVFRGVSERFYQTATAMGGSELVIGIVALPLSIWYNFGGAVEIAALLSLVLAGWSLAVASHIFHHSLEINRFSSFGLSLAYLFISYLIAGLVAAPGS